MIQSMKKKAWEPFRIRLLNSTTNPAYFHPNIFKMTLYHKRGVKNGFNFALQFFFLIFDSLGGVYWACHWWAWSWESLWEGFLHREICELKTDLAIALLENHLGRFTKTTSNHKLVRLRNITISSTGVLKSSNSTALRILWTALNSAMSSHLATAFRNQV